MAWQKLILDKFAGMKSVGDPTDNSPNSARDIRDIVFSPQSALSTRPGFLKSNTTSLNYGIYGLYDYKTRFTQKTIVADANGNLIVL